MKALSIRAFESLAAAAVLFSSACAAGGGEGRDEEYLALSKLQALITEAPDDYAGLVVDEAQGVATVYVVDLRSATAVPRIERLLDGGALVGPTGRYAMQYRPVKRSQRELDAIRDAISADHAWIERAGGELLEWGAAPDRNVVEVGVVELTPELEAAARERFGSDVELFEAERQMTEAWRGADTSPYYGGIDLRSGTQGACTAGWAIQNINTPSDVALTTAGHCYAQGSNVTNGGVSVGQLVLQVWQQNGLDIAFIRGQQYAGRTYVGAFNSSSHLPVKGFSLGTWVGQSVCTNGATWGEVCGAIVRERDKCFITDTNGLLVNTCRLTKIENTNATLGTVGDSGSGVFTRWGDGVVAVGSYVGGPRNISSSIKVMHEITWFMPQGWKIKTQ